jgi:putative SOS response-associated peptidase YedK
MSSTSRAPTAAFMALAGVWENWHLPAGEWVRSFAIVTTTPNELCAKIHNRMPVILKPEAWAVWLGEEPAEEPQLKALLAPYPSDEMICWPVSARVGNVKNNDSSLIEPVAARWRSRTRSSSARPPARCSAIISTSRISGPMS